ncbi:Phage integrase [Hyella patelloides LEGE 07179]|uniref:Phage integrase n=1 Tax=Hyella patelloides LEGE 07179 TaxID=945734 RepID=A0A563W3L8_9CYAN|nr:tyrosine-type recombinase/integrase [Hyella patelloides]VEP18268.1 Phage integrase [Hyella patelloides LEGE 07179]
MLPIEALQEKIRQSELGQEWINNPLLDRDIWSLEELGYAAEELKIKSKRNIIFKHFSLPWLKLLTKSTVLAMVKSKFSLDTVVHKVCYLKQLNEFLVTEGYFQPELLDESILQKFVTTGSKGVRSHRLSTIAYVTRLWREEQWLMLSYTPLKYKQETPKVEVVPEEVLHQVYENFDLFPQPLERLFRLQLALGVRIGEMLRMPRQCLKKEGKQWFLLRWLEKRKHWRFSQIHPAVAELVKEQQKFLDKQFGSNSDFDKLFCKTSNINDGTKKSKRFEKEPIYLPELLSYGSISAWLREFSEKTSLKDKQGNKFHLTSHKLRRTKASIMAYCEAEDEYIAAVLGHGSLDMLPHYRKRSLERLEKEVNAKGYVDMYGRVTSFKPRKRRYEKLAELLKVSTPLGECHRPTMLGDCQYRYACISCDHHRVTLEDKPKLKTDIQRLQQDLREAETVGQERRITEIKRLLVLLKTRLQGLKKLENLRE